MNRAVSKTTYHHTHLKGVYPSIAGVHEYREADHGVYVLACKTNGKRWWTSCLYDVSYIPRPTGLPKYLAQDVSLGEARRVMYEHDLGRAIEMLGAAS